MLLVVLLCSLSLAATAQQADNDWIDPYDMLNYDASTKTMRKPAEPTKGREEPCSMKVVELEKQIEDLKKTITVISEKPTCNPVFKRFLSRLLKKIQGVGLPSDSADVLCDAKIQLSKQAMSEIQRLLEGEDSGGTGALDDAISQLLVELRPHNHELWKWRFEDNFGVELDTLLKMGLCVLVITAIICTQLWSSVSWFVQFSRLFAICFFVSIIWNWFYLYKIAFAEHQNNMAKLDSGNEKCTGMRKIDWSDSLKEWFRSTWTLQDDPCKKYYEVLMVNPILLVPPTKAISVTITTFITEPLKHFGQGISEFLRALLKDLPVTLQIPVLLTVVLSIVICMYGGVQGAFQHGIAAPFRRPQRDPPPPPLEQHQHQPQRIDDLAGGDRGREALQYAPRHQADDGRLYRNQVHQRCKRSREVVVETLCTAEPPRYEDEPDAEPRKEEQDLSAESESENQPETQEELGGASASSVAANTAQSKTKPSESDPSQAKTKPSESDPSQAKTKPSESDPSQAKTKPSESDPSQAKTKPSESDPSQAKTKPSESDPSQAKTKPSESDPSQAKTKPTESDPSRAKTKPTELYQSSSQDDASLPVLINFQDQQVSPDQQASSGSLTHIETVGVRVQESYPVLVRKTDSALQED